MPVSPLDATSRLTVPASPDLAVESFTIEGWIKTPDANNPRPIAEYAAETGHGTVHFWHNFRQGGASGSGALYGLVRGTNGAYLEVSTPPNALVSNSWTHVAFTMDYAAKTAELFVNGQLLGSATNPNLAPADTSLPFNIGHRPAGSAELLAGRQFIGQMDELTLYRRALSWYEIERIYNTASLGKGGLPLITAQPANQTVNVGGQASFEVTATGSSPLSYQWYRNDASVFGGTSRVLVLTNVQPEQAGRYSVCVSNMYGFEVSSNAILNVVTQQQQCIAAPLGLVGWWKAEGNVEDSALNNDATVVGFPRYGVGKVGTGFRFSGTNGYRVPASPSLAVTSFTIEGWIKTSATSTQPIAEYANETGEASILFWHNVLPGALYGGVRGTNGAYLLVSTPNNVVPSNTWVHVAFTLDHQTKVGRLFMNGQNVAVGTNQDLAVPDSMRQFNIGRRPDGSDHPLNGVCFDGSIDELSVYNRALAPAEVAEIYQSAESGKCPIPTNPGGTTPPQPFPAIYSLSQPGRGTNTFELLLRGNPGEIYRVQRSTSIMGPWQDVGPAAMDALGRGAFEDTSANSQKGFYRLVK